MEIGGLHYTMTLHALCLRINELLPTICLSLSSHYGFKSSRGRKQFPERKEFPAEEGNRKELFIRFTASAFRKLPSIYVFSYFPFGFEGRMWDLIVSVPNHCLSFYFVNENRLSKRYHSTAGFKSVSQYTAQQRVAAVKKCSKYSESLFDSLVASGILWWLKCLSVMTTRWWYLNASGYHVILLWSRCLSVAVTYLAVRCKAGGTRFKAPLLNNRCVRSSIRIAGDISVLLFCLYIGGYLQQWKQ